MTKRRFQGSSVNPGRFGGRRKVERARPTQPPGSVAAPGFEQAVQFHEAGRLDDAESIYRRILAAEPGHFESLHLLGVIEAQRGNHAQAVRQMDAAIQLNPKAASAYNNRGLALAEMGETTEALASFDAAIAISPDHAAAFFGRGNALAKLKRFDEALASLDKAIALKPDYVAALFNRGNVLSHLKRHNDALASFDKVVALEPDHVDALFNRGNTLAELKRPDEAVASFDRLLALKPDYDVAWFNRGNILKELNRFDEALQSFDKYVALKPNHAKGYNNRGIVLSELKQYDEALQDFDRAIALEPNYSRAFNNRGIALKDLKRLEDAVASFDKAIALDPGYAEAFNNRGTALKDIRGKEEALANFDQAIALKPDFYEAHNNRGITLHEMKRQDEALASYDRAVALKPDYAEAINNRGICGLLAGRYKNGWADYESRWKIKELKTKRPDIKVPLWRGEDISGRDIVVYSEQGLGDVIHFARYLPLLVQRNARVTFSVASKMNRLLRPLTQHIRILNTRKVGDGFDFQCALMSLPLFFGTDAGTIPNQVPYLSAEDGLVARWRSQIGDHGFKVGIAWQGSPKGKIDRGRSIRLSEFLPLARIPGVRLISLQKQHGLDQLDRLPPDVSIELLGGDFDSGPDAFIDTAAVMANLDLIITSDTSIAHIAGALGRPTWVALKYVPDWRWLLERDDSPWYPTMRLFRQSTEGDWRSVFSNIAEELRLSVKSVDRPAPRQPKHTPVPRRSFDVTQAFKKAVASYQAGLLDEAEEACREILDLRSDHFRSLHLMGVIAGQKGNREDAIRRIGAALEINPNLSEAHNNLGLLLMDSKRLDEALASFDRAVAVRLGYAEAFLNRGNVLMELERFEEALASFDQAIALDPKDPQAFSSRGNALKELKRLDDALLSYDRAIALKPDNPRTFSNRGNVLLEQKRLPEALASYDRAIALRADYLEGRTNRAICRLLAGHFADGLRDYEWRWNSKEFPSPRPPINAPVWRGEDLRGRRIAAYSEQGLGDVLQFARYLPLLVQRGAKVTCLVDARLHRILGTLSDGIRITDTIAASDVFDFQCALMSLPLGFDDQAPPIPNRVPYLKAERARVARWKERIGTQGLKIGIAWQGSPKGRIDKGRSIPLEQFAPLSRIPGAGLVSLQRKDGLDQLARMRGDVEIEVFEDLDDGSDAFIDSAALMESLDLIITSDTSIAHLAGALGRPTWLALKQVPDWRWMLDREDSPWYPTMRLFRQTTDGDWSSVFSRIEDELKRLISSRKDPGPHKLVDEAEAHFNCGNAMAEANRLEEAVASFDNAIALNPDHAPALNNRGITLMKLGRLEQALTSFNEAIRIKPDHARAFNNRGTVLHLLKRRDEALTSYDKAILLDPSYAKAFNGRGAVLRELKRRDEALASHDKAIALDPHNAEAFNNRGTVLNELRRRDEALASYGMAIALKPDFAEAFNNRGIVMKELKRLDEARVAYDGAIAIRPDYADAFMNRGMCNLLAGRYREGWQDYEWRWDSTDFPSTRRTIAAPLWRGEDLANRRLAVYAEQGLGDIIQFVRYLPLLVERGARITFFVKPKLMRLLQPLTKQIRVSDEIDPREIFDYQCPLLGLPFRFRTELESVPGKVPYLRAEKELVARWKAKIGGHGFKIGIAWQGNPRGEIDEGRSIPLAEFLPLSRLPGVRLISLQKHNGLDQLVHLPGNGRIEIPGDDFDGGADAFIDAAAVMESLDLIITSDTSIAHLAGALGRPTWIALKHVPDWRWLLDREDSPWYPTIRLFRQSSDGDWKLVFSRIERELRRMIEPEAPRPILDDAEICFRRALSLKNANRLNDALASLNRTIELKPGHAEAFNTRGIVLTELHRLDEALASFNKAVELNPSDASVFNNRGIVLMTMKRLDEALASFDQAIELRPDYTQAFNNRGIALTELRRLQDALSSFDRAAMLEPSSAEVFFNRANALAMFERHDEALADLDRAIAIKADYAEAFFSRGTALLNLDRSDEALPSFDRAISLRPNYAAAFNNRGNALRDLRRFNEALMNFDQAIAIRPAFAEAHLNRGMALRELERRAEALASYDKAIELRSDYFEAITCRATVLKEMSRFDEAFAEYDRAIALEPDFAVGRFHRAVSRLLLGRYQEGWAEYEWRLKTKDFAGERPKIDAPQWQGEDIGGRRIVVYAEQGVGDIIQFARYLPLLLQRNAAVSFLVDARLHRLLRSLDPRIQLLERKSTTKAIDTCCALLSLPLRFGTTETSIPAEVPYLKPEKDLVARWKARLGDGGYKIGIAWQGNPKGDVDVGRSVPLAEFATLARLNGVRLISLQKHHGVDQLAALPADVKIESLGSDFDSGPDAFVDTAAVMEKLDLIITSDTAVAHLAGALGRPTWVALKHVPDWRWLLDREDSLWYPTMRLFRQSTDGDWHSVLSRITHELRLMLSTDVTGMVGREQKHQRVAPGRPPNTERIFKRAVASYQARRLDEAERACREVLDHQPDHFRSLHLLGVIAGQRNDNEEAIRQIGSALRLNPNLSEAHCNLGISLIGLNRMDEALVSFDRALALKPNYMDALLHRGHVLMQLKRFDEALASYERIVAVSPNYAEAFNSRGNAFRALKRSQDALRSYDRAILIKSDYAEAFNNRGTVLLDLRRLDEAVLNFENAIALRSDHTEAIINRGHALRLLGRPADALQCYERAIELQPSNAEAFTHRGLVLRLLGRASEAFASYDKAFSLKHDARYVEGDRLHAKLQLCDWSNYESECSSLLSAMQKGEPACRPFEFLTAISDPAAELRCAKLYVESRNLSSATPLWTNEVYSHARIRVAYLSADFHDHATSYLARGLFKLHDRARFETIALSFGPDDNGPMRRELERSFEHFHDVRTKDDRTIAELIRSLEVDIAVDLKGFTRHARAGILAHRPAPIQVSYLGFPGTMGAGHIDYIIADKIVLPFDQQPFFSEKIVHLPDSYQVNDSKRAFARRTPARADAGLPDHGFVFCCFNNSYKITPRIFDVWMALLRRVEGSVLWLLDDNPTARENLCAEASRRGVNPARLVFANRVPVEDHLVRHRLADVFLDTVPCNAHTTASDGLWMGLPVVTLYGNSFAGRVAASLLHAVGIPELVTHNMADYESLALRLASEPSFLRSIRDKLAANRTTQPLFDTDRFRRHLESAYTTMWERYKAGRLPQSFSVPAMKTGAMAPGAENQPSSPISSGDVTQLFKAAVRAYQADQLAEAEMDCRRVLETEPNHFRSLHLLGVVASQKGDNEEAVHQIRAALRINPNLAEAENNLGIALMNLQRLDEALESFDRAVSLRPGYVDALLNRGDALIALKRYEEALISYDRAIAVKPDSAEAFNNRGNALAELKRMDEALTSFNKALALKTNFTTALNNRGNALREMNRLQEALVSHDMAIAINPRDADAYKNRGAVLKEMRRLDEALASFDKAIALKPDFADGLRNRGMCRLLAGRFKEGWLDYEWRREIRAPESKRNLIDAPAWQGEDVSGRSLAITCEQGLGDVIQFARYLPLLVERGGRVTLFADAKLHRVLETLSTKIRIANTIPRGETFDFQCALMSLPLRFDTDAQTIPNRVPYLRAENDLVARWKARIGDHGFKIGIAWQGSRAKIDQHRSVPLAAFASLSHVSGVRLISLQKHHGLEQLAGLPPDVRIELLSDFDEGPDAFVDTAAVMQNLDLVITSDTSVAHLAGALGRPTWVALKYVPEWRWLLDREDSPWYPTMRLFRQSTEGDWKSVFSKFEHELRLMLPQSDVASTPPSAPHTVSNPNVQVSWGELMDKISILQIKERQLKAPDAIANVRRELAILQDSARGISSVAAVTPLVEELRSVNEALWDIEDKIRANEAAQTFGNDFVQLARAVYFQNDKRGSLKRRINELTNSAIIEEKQYTSYQGHQPDARVAAPQPSAEAAVNAGPLLESANLRIKKCKHGLMMFLANDMYIGRSLDLYGEFSEGETLLFKQFVQPGMTVIDVGANIGAHTLFFSHAVGRSGQVFAFEPQRLLYQMLCGNVALNMCNNVIAVHAGLGCAPGHLPLPRIDYSAGGNFGGVSLSEEQKGERVPLQTLDSHDLKACHLIKIDVEGMEREVLEGAASIVEQHKPFLYVENDRLDLSADLIEWLMEKNYRVYWHTPPLFNPKNHFGRSENVFSRMISINMLCIPASKSINVHGLREVSSPRDTLPAQARVRHKPRAKAAKRP